MTDHPKMGLVDVYAAIIPALDYQPALHVFYSESVLPVHDGLPKMRDVPAEMGGSGECCLSNRPALPPPGLLVARPRSQSMASLP